jgi:hypothetical protein
VCQTLANAGIIVTLTGGACVAIWSMRELHYEPTTGARPVVIEEDGGITRIVVAMQGVYAPVPGWLWDLDVLSVVVGPLAFVASLVVRSTLRLPKPPRAVFEITVEEFKLTETCRTTGRRTTFTLPRSALVEARANRYEAGL